MTYLVAAAFLLGLWALVRWMSDKRTPEERLGDAYRDGDRTYLDEHLPPLPMEEVGRIADRTAEKMLDDEEDGLGAYTDEGFQARFEERMYQERLTRYVASRPKK